MFFILSYVAALVFILLALNEMRITFYEVQVYHGYELLVSTNMTLESKTEAEIVRTQLVEQCRDHYGDIELVSYVLTRSSLRYGLYQAMFEVLNFTIRCSNSVIARLFE